MNLALALAALLSFAGASGFFPQLVPSRWLLAPWLTASATSTLSAFTVLAARIGVNLWLPASVFMVLFWVAGLHRKLGAPRKIKLASRVLLFAWIANIALACVPFMIGRSEAAGALMVVMGMYLAPVYLAISAAIIIAAAVELVAMGRYGGSTPSHAAVPLLLWAIVPPVLSVVPLLLAPSNPIATSAKESTEFATLCKDVGVKFMEKPAGPVRSVAYDWDPERLKVRPEHGGRIEIDADGRVKGYYGGMLPPSSPETHKTLALEFIETRGGKNPDGLYYRFPGSGIEQPQGFDALTADVVAFLDVDKPEELQKAPVRQGTVRYTLTLTDRRSGAMLGVQTYVVDRINWRACGANIANTISQNAFIYDAINR